MRAHRVSGGWLHSFLPILNAPATSSLGKEPPQLPFNKRLGGPQSQSGYSGEEKNLLYMLGIELQLDHPACSPVTTYTLTMLTQLSV